MPATHASTLTALTANLLDVLDEARSTEAALHQIDLFRRVVAGDGIFSIQQNVTTERDSPDQVLLRRLYSSEADRFPVQGAKRKTLSPWTERLFVEGRIFVGEGVDVLARTFDDFEQMRPYALQSVVNVPLLQGRLCYATFNVFGTRSQWLPHEILGIRLLAMAAARWVPPAPGLFYSFTGPSLACSLEA